MSKLNHPSMTPKGARVKLSKANLPPKNPNTPAALRKLSQELQPVEFTDVALGEPADLGPYKNVLLINTVLLPTGFLLLLAGWLVLVYETDQMFINCGIVFIVMGVVFLIGNVSLEWWVASRTAKSVKAPK